MASDLSYVEAESDLDGDGIRDILAYGAHRLLVLASDLRVKAFRADTVQSMPSGLLSVAIRKGLGAPPELLTARGSKLVASRLVPNRFHLAFLYGPWVLLATAVIGLPGAALGIRRRRLRSHLQERVQALVMDTAPDGLLLLEPGGHVQSTNKTLRRWLGLAETLPGRSRLEDVLKLAPSATAFCRGVLAADPPRRHEMSARFDLTGGERVLRLVAEPVSGGLPGRPYWLVRFEDRPAESELREARGWALVAESIAHDFRKPANAMHGRARRIQAESRTLTADAAPRVGALAEDVAEQALVLLRKADRLVELFNRHHAATDVDLNAFVSGMAESLRRLLPPDIRIERRLGGDAPVVRMDRRRMESVLENLVANSVNAMPNGGTITVATDLVRGAQLTPHRAARDYAALEIADEGVGIPDSSRDRLFEPGFTTTDGWGLGLFTVKKTIDDHDGVIRVESEPGAGSTFTVFLPLDT